MRKIHPSSWKSVISPASCERSYLKTATDGSAGIKWHLRTAAFGWMPTRCSWSLWASVCVWQCVSVCMRLHMCTLMQAFVGFYMYILASAVCVCVRREGEGETWGNVCMFLCVLVQEGVCI